MTTNHTPMPWIKSDHHHVVFGADGFEVTDPMQGPHVSQSWHENETGRHWAEKGEGHDYLDRTDEQTEANAAFIVKACNAHDDLVGACQTALSNLTLKYPEDHLVMKRLKAALAKAEGKIS